VRKAFLTALTIVLVACCPGDQVDERGWPKELVLGLVPSLEAEAMVDNLGPLADFLSDELGMPVTSFVPQDYTGLVEALGTGRADIGMLPPFAAMLGQRRYDIETILISVRNGETGYRSQFMTNDPSVCDTPVVTDERGHRAPWRQTAVRYVGRLLCELTLGVGYLLVLVDPRHQGLHDRIARTLVVRT